MKWGGPYSRMPHGYWRDADVLIIGEKVATFLLKMSDFADDNETDAVVTDLQMTTLGSKARVKKDTAVLAGQALIERTESNDGWRIVDWLDGHKTAAQLAKLRAERREAGRKGGKRSRRSKSPSPTNDDEATGNQVAEANAKQVAKQTGTGRLSPVPSLPSTVPTHPHPPPPPPEPELTPKTEADDLSEVVEVVAVADAFVQTLGYLDEPAGLDIQRYVARALKRGWEDDDVIDVAAEAAGRPDVGDVRAYAVGGLKRLANTYPPAEHTERPTTEPEISLDFADLTGLPADPDDELAARYGAET